MGLFLDSLTNHGWTKFSHSHDFTCTEIFAGKKPASFPRYDDVLLVSLQRADLHDLQRRSSDSHCE